LSYSLILFIEKVGFDSHSLTAHNHSDDNHDNHSETEINNRNLDYNNNLKEILNPKDHLVTEKIDNANHYHKNLNHYENTHTVGKETKRKRSIMDTNCEHECTTNVEDIPDVEEETIKNVVSSRGKFVSLLQARNICKFFIYLI